MEAAGVLIISLGCSLLLAGCSGSSDGDDDSGAADDCTCGNHRPDDRDTVCMTMAARVNFDACASCCITAGYSGVILVGEGDGGACTCYGHTDTTICAAALEHTVPDQACSYCCLEQGFLGAGYVGFGNRECGCIDF